MSSAAAAASLPLLSPQLLLLLLVMLRAGCGVAVMGVVENMRWACAVGAACDPRCAGFDPRPLGKGGAGRGWRGPEPQPGMCANCVHCDAMLSDSEVDYAVV